MLDSVLLIGAGKMGGALAQRWQDIHLCRRLIVIEPSGHHGHLKSPKDIPADFGPQAIVFAVKPQTLPEIVKDYESYIGGGALVVSIAAGKPISFFEAAFGPKAKVVRSMPNLPASIGKGITVACANKNVSLQEKAWAAALLGAVGEVLWVDDESLLNPVTALSGSGPAYVFLLIEAMTKAGIRIGLAPAMAEKLARQTVIGSAALAEASPDIPAATLRENVTSPGGTTQAALSVLMAEPAIQALFDKALAAATKRAEELSK